MYYLIRVDYLDVKCKRDEIEIVWPTLDGFQALWKHPFTGQLNKADLTQLLLVSNKLFVYVL